MVWVVQSWQREKAVRFVCKHNITCLLIFSHHSTFTKRTAHCIKAPEETPLGSTVHNKIDCCWLFANVVTHVIGKLRLTCLPPNHRPFKD